MRKCIKKMVVGVLALAMLLGMSTVSFAKNDKKTETTEATTEATAETTEAVKLEPQKVSKVTCTASGKVNVSFKGKVTYTDALKVTITDEEGKETECRIKKKNKGTMQIAVSGLVKGQKYTLTIDGVLAKNAKEAVTITKTFTAKGMKTACKVSKASVTKKFVTLKMKSKAYYKDATVTIRDADGNVYDAKIVKKSKGNIKVRVAGLKTGKKYTVTVTGVKTKKEKSYSSITKTFTAK